MDVIVWPVCPAPLAGGVAAGAAGAAAPAGGSAAGVGAVAPGAAAGTAVFAGAAAPVEVGWVVAGGGVVGRPTQPEEPDVGG